MKKIISLFIALTMLLPLLPVFAADGEPELPELKSVPILYTSDIHDHIYSERYLTDKGDVSRRGGFARLAALIKAVKIDNPDPLLVDCGDFSMGTPIQTLYKSDAPELRLMGELGYDAVTLGNHEFDYRTQGLTDMLKTAVEKGDKLPELIASNINWEKTFADEDLRGAANNLRSALDKYGFEENWTLIEKSGVTIAVFGLLGKQAVSYAPESGLVFTDYIKRAKEIVKAIKAEGKAEMIVCLSHSGLEGEPEKTEDELLAAAVPDIDLIVSGHSHTFLPQPKTVGKTHIVACGAYLEYVGYIKLTQEVDKNFKPTGRWIFGGNYKPYTLGEQTPEDPDILAQVEAYAAKVDTEYFGEFGYSFEQKLTESAFSLKPFAEVAQNPGEEMIGSLVADAYLQAVNNLSDGDKAVAAVAPYGTIRGSFIKGDITVADAFNVLSLGSGADGSAGYPLVSVYLTGAELKTMAEVDISVGDMMKEARLYISGLRYNYNTDRLILNRVTDVTLNGEEIENGKLYRVVAGLYSAQMLGMVEGKSVGLLKITPKDKNGKKITDFDSAVIKDRQGRELKEWAALASYLDEFKTLPDKYSEGYYSDPEHPEHRNERRKIRVVDKNIVAIFKQPNNVFFLVLFAVILFLGLITTPVVIFGRRAAKKRKALQNKISHQFDKATEMNPTDAEIIEEKKKQREENN